MVRRKFPVFLILMSALVTLTWSSGPAYAAKKDILGNARKAEAERKAAAKRAQARGLKPGVAGVTAAAIPAPGAIDGPGGIPHYFGPYGNWAFSPLPKGPVTSVTIVMSLLNLPTSLRIPTTF